MWIRICSLLVSSCTRAEKWDSEGLFPLLPPSFSSAFREHSTSCLNQRNTYQHSPLENAREMKLLSNVLLHFAIPGQAFSIHWATALLLVEGDEKIGPALGEKFSSTNGQWVGHWHLHLVESKLIFPTWQSRELPGTIKCRNFLLPSKEKIF